MADGGGFVVDAGSVSVYEAAEVEMSAKIKETLQSMAESLIKGGTGDIMPHVMVMGFGRPAAGHVGKLPERSLLFAMAIDFNTDLEKQVALRQCARKCLEEDLVPVSVGLLSEAWTVQLAPNEKLGTLQVADREDRSEAVVVFVGSVGHKVSMSMTCNVERDASNKFVVKPRPDGSPDWLVSERSESRLIRKFWRAMAIAWRDRPERTE